MIDPHVHCRDWSQSYKETIEHALSVAERIGLSGIFDMPNTSPPINSRELVEKRLRDAEKVGSKVFYGLYVGLTSNPEQIKEAVRAWRALFPKSRDKVGVIGLKMFAGHSVGNLGIIKEEEQKLVYQTLAEENFDGVLAVHCEKESLLKKDLWNPLKPRTHSYARPPEAEVESVRDQINFASEFNFKGNLHILHVSVPESVLLVDEARGRIKISCGLTPHHCLLNYDLIPESEEGILCKVNPPLRSQEDAEQMLAFLKQGKIDWIETDHAPHVLKDKLQEFMSGFPGLPFYPHFLSYLKKDGFTEEQIKNLTHENICKIFNLKLVELDIEPDLNLHNEYEVDVYKEARK